MASISQTTDCLTKHPNSKHEVQEFKPYLSTQLSPHTTESSNLLLIGYKGKFQQGLIIYSTKASKQNKKHTHKKTRLIVIVTHLVTSLFLGAVSKLMSETSEFELPTTNTPQFRT